MVCPECGVEIKRFDLSPVCRNCGANLMYYTQKTGLLHDAKMTELEFAKARMFFARVKAAFIGSPLAIVRIVLSVACACMFLIPFAGIKVDTPVFSTDISVGIIGAINIYKTALYKAIFDMMNISPISGAARDLFILCVLFAAGLLCAAAVFVCELLSFIKLDRGTKFICGFSFAGALFAAASFIYSLKLSSDVSTISYLDFHTGFGSLAAFAAFAAMAFVNIIILKRGLKVLIKDVDVKRTELLAKVRSGEVDIDEYPLPIYETPEEKEKRLQLYADSKKSGEAKADG